MKLDISVGPSVNAMYRNVPGVGRVKSSDYKKWAKVAMMEMMAQRKLPLPIPPVCLTIRVPDTNGRGDISNRVKAVEDILVRMGVLSDDNDKIIRKLIVEVGAAKGRCEIELEEYR
jgi:Holliday junction resolvase RusA-like endonuclease